MSKFKNMKIEINEQQPIDEVVKELERLGYKKCADPSGSLAVLKHTSMELSILDI